MQNKKGFLLGEVSVKLIIAILAILVLAVLGAKLFGMFAKENDVRLAGENLKLILEKVAFLQGDEYTEEFLYVIVFPPGEDEWNLISYHQSYFPSGQCVGNFETCLCMCNNFNCNGLIACEGFEEEVVVDEKYEETQVQAGPAPVIIDPNIHKNTLKLLTSSFELKISKEKDEFNKEFIKIKKSDKNDE